MAFSLSYQLAEAVRKKMKDCSEANYGGLIINTCGWIKGEGYQCITHAATSFEVSVVVVLDHERLFNELQRDLPSFVKVLHQPKSGGVENRSREMRISARNASVHKYFYGTRAYPLYPYTFEVAFTDLTICKIGAEPLPLECLPFGMKPEDHRTKVVTVMPSLSLVHHMLSVSPCTSVDQSVLTTNVMGFVVLTAVDMEKKAYSVLSPNPGPLPSKICLLSEITFVDDKVRE